MKTQSVLIGLGAGLCLLFATAATAAMYRYLDENGQVVYSEKPPPSGNATLIKPPPPPPTQPPSAEGKPEGNAAAGDQPAGTDEPKTAEQEARDKESQRIKDSNCKTAREALKQYTDPQYGFVKTPDGRFVELTKERRTQGKKDAEKAVKEFCD